MVSLVKLVTFMVFVAGMGFVPAAGPVTFDCVALSPKSGDIDPICGLFERRLQEAFPDRQVTRGPDADVVLVVESATAKSFFARLDWRGHPAGQALGIAQRDADLDDTARSSFIDTLLQSSPR